MILVASVLEQRVQSLIKLPVSEMYRVFTDLVSKYAHSLKISVNMHIYWFHIFTATYPLLATLVQRSDVKDTG